jgi:hypothetical protein
MVQSIGPSLVVFSYVHISLPSYLLDIMRTQADASLLIVNASLLLPFHLNFVKKFSAAIHMKFSHVCWHILENTTAILQKNKIHQDMTSKSRQ